MPIPDFSDHDVGIPIPKGSLRDTPPKKSRRYYVGNVMEVRERSHPNTPLSGVLNNLREVKGGLMMQIGDEEIRTEHLVGNFSWGYDEKNNLYVEVKRQ